MCSGRRWYRLVLVIVPTLSGICATIVDAVAVVPPADVARGKTQGSQWRKS